MENTTNPKSRINLQISIRKYRFYFNIKYNFPPIVVKTTNLFFSAKLGYLLECDDHAIRVFYRQLFSTSFHHWLVHFVSAKKGGSFVSTTSNVYTDSRGTVTSVRDTRERRVTFPIDYANHVSGRRGCIFIRLARDWRSDGLEESGTVAKFSTIDGKKRQRKRKDEERRSIERFESWRKVSGYESVKKGGWKLAARYDV